MAVWRVSPAGGRLVGVVAGWPLPNWMPSAIDRCRPPATPVHRLGEQVFDAVAEIGDVGQFFVLDLGLDLSPPAAVVGAGADLLRDRREERLGGGDHGNVHRHGAGGSGLSSFAMMGLATRLGSVINISIVRELGPVLAATMLAGRVGSSMAAELGTMRVTEQIDALSALGTNPIYYLVVPRFLACLLLIPL